MANKQAGKCKKRREEKGTNEKVDNTHGLNEVSAERGSSAFQTKVEAG